MKQTLDINALLIAYGLGTLLMSAITPRPKHRKWLLARAIVCGLWPLMLVCWIVFLISFRNRIKEHKAILVGERGA